MVFLALILLISQTTYAVDNINKLIDSSYQEAEEEYTKIKKKGIYFIYKPKHFKEVRFENKPTKVKKWNDFEQSIKVVDEKIESLKKKLNLDGEWGNIRLKTNKTIDTLKLQYEYDF
ncbi:hypothetical protein MNB_SUP05-5-1101 [hydrothermal vent metagenome]|uniref:Uncharacterized protein n=1 Tax=hydrothermal vent metagenome TaxID=652676 RepID=A0A1W1BZ22_9ZZZZ